MDPDTAATDNLAGALQLRQQMTSTSIRLTTVAAIVGAGLLAITAATVAQGSSLTRGPYLQMGTPTSILVRWRTATLARSVVRFGTAPGQLTSTASGGGATTEHVVPLTGLEAHTRYFYAVGDGSTDLAGGDLAHSFVTSPAPDSQTATRIWVLGDSGTADANAMAVRDAYLATDRARGTDLWLMLGDNAYTTGTDGQYQQAVFDTYPEVLRQAVLWPTFGNHDAASADSATQTGPYYDIFTLPTRGEAGGVPSGTEAYYAFDYGNIHIVCLDSTESDRSPAGPMLTWLARDLAANRAEWTIAFFHHAPYSKGSHDSDAERELAEMRQNAVPILDMGGVDLVLSGHSHSYERSVLLTGHTGPSTTLSGAMVLDANSGASLPLGGYRKVKGTPGAVYVTAGSSGQVSGGSLNHPVMTTSLNTLGSLVIDVDGPRLQVRFLSSTGVERDEVLFSSHSPAGVPGPPTGLNNRAQGGLDLSWQPAYGGGVPEGYIVEGGTRLGAGDLGAVATERGRAPTFGEYRWPFGSGRFYLRTRAWNAAGVGPASEDLELQVIPGGSIASTIAPTLAATVSGAAVTLVAGPADRGSFVVEVGSAPGRTDLGSLPLIVPQVTVPNVPAGVYYLRARVVSGPLQSPPSADVQIVVGGVPSPPDVPGALRPSVIGDVVSLAWAPPTVGPPPSRYVVEAGLSPRSFDLGRVRTPSARPGLTLSGVPRGTYYVRVSGENDRGEGPSSAAIRVGVR